MIIEVKKFISIWNEFMYILTPKQKRMGVAVFVLILLGSVAELFSVSVILPLVQTIIQSEDIVKNPIINLIVNMFMIESTLDLFIVFSIFVIIIFLAKNIFLSFVSWVRVKYSTKIQRELSLKMIKSYINRGYNFFRNNNTSVLLRGCSQSIGSVEAIISYFFKLVSEILTIICIFIYITYVDFHLAMTIVFLAVISMLIIMLVLRNIMHEAGKKHFELGAVNTQWLLQLFNGIKEVLVMKRQDYFIDNFHNSYKKQQKAFITQNIAIEMPAYVIEGICIVGVMTSLAFRFSTMENPIDYIPQLAMFAMAIFRVMPSMGKITACINGLMFHLPAARETYINIKEANSIDKNIDNVDEVKEAKLFDLSYCLVVDNVKFKYSDGNSNVIDGITIKIERGESVAFVGSSGAGKSTLADIILGLFKPQDGAVYINNKNVLEMGNEVKNLIGFVPQSVYLIDDTIRRNIAFGINDDEIDDEMVWEVLKKAQLNDYIGELPLKLDTIIGDRGIKFSGGQIQRMAIARALYNNPDIIIFDEATSALDNETETAVMESIESLQGDKTLIIIAHRLTTVRKCSHIYEIKDGKAIERKYEELLVNI